MATLEGIAKQYGMNIDYLDQHTGLIYSLQEAMEKEDDSTKLDVPVYKPNRLDLYGFATMDKPANWKGK